jgi:predicted esterase
VAVGTRDASAAAATGAVTGDASAPLAPLPELTGFFEALPVPGHPDAWMSLPTGATNKRPVVVVIHGAGDRPDWQCGGWRRATRELAFVVCPRGAYAALDSTKEDARYTHRGGTALLEYIDASLAAVEARYPDYADTSTPILAGFSLGASEILALAVQAPARFPRIALVEGGTNGWTDARIDAYRTGGGQRVLYGTGQRANEAAARTAVKRLIAKGLDARVVYAPVNHTFDPPLEDAVRGELEWFVAGDPRWEL